jgi:hypothetical protein
LRLKFDVSAATGRIVFSGELSRPSDSLPIPSRDNIIGAHPGIYGDIRREESRLYRDSSCMHRGEAASPTSCAQERARDPSYSNFVRAHYSRDATYGWGTVGTGPDRTPHARRGAWPANGITRRDRGGGQGCSPGSEVDDSERDPCPCSDCRLRVRAACPGRQRRDDGVTA